LLELVGMPGMDGRMPGELSGGEQQRVALARALACTPELVLLDEPFSGLDASLRAQVRQEVRAILLAAGVTALFVTHDQEDAFAVADRVALIRRGRLLQVGPPEELYDRPASRAVAEFIGHATLVPARLAGGDLDARLTIAIDGTERVLGWASAAPLGAGDVLAVLRPDALAFAAPEVPGAWSGVVTGRRFAGALLAYHVRLSDKVEVELYSSERGVREGDRVGVRVVREPVAVVAP
ncbi:MAG: ABC transporter ATP-binding protein, partial [Gemmatimonadota bacterium]|nr:ABC transporter ATP-binding protein [Gemmatimonadota bacterium]